MVFGNTFNWFSSRKKGFA